MDTKKKWFKIEVFLVILFAIISPLLFLMYGNCQISSLHFRVQCYVMPKCLPKIMLPRNYNDYDYGGLGVYKNYSGVWRAWYKNGTLGVEKSFLNGKEHGREIFYYESGRINSECYFENGRLTGIKRVWYDSDKKQIWKEENFIDLGTIEFNSWKENGNKLYFLKSSRGIINLAEKYYENGNIEYKIEYVNGNKSAVLTEWEETGKLKRIFEFNSSDDLPTEISQNVWGTMKFRY